MIVGLNKIIEDGRYGMPAKDIESFRKAANKGDIVVGVRPVSKFARYFLELHYPTKPFRVKNKSCNTGPMAGLISEEFEYGRPVELTPDEKNKIKQSLTQEQTNLPSEEQQKIIQEKQDQALQIKREKAKSKHNEEYNKAKKAGLESTPLKLTEDRLLSLTTELLPGKFNFKKINDESLKNDAPVKYEITWISGDTEMRAYAIQNQGENAFSITKDIDGKNPINVLGQNVTDKNGKNCVIPITADYDLLVVSPSYRDFDPGNKHKAPFNTQGVKPGAEKKNQDRVIESERLAKNNDNTAVKTSLREIDGVLHEEIIDTSLMENKWNKLPQEDPSKGNASEATTKTIDLINNEIAIGDPERAIPGLETVHHNQEFYNPFADELKNNIPAIFFLPAEMDLSSIPGGQKNVDVVLIETVEEMVKLREIVQQHNYYWPAHAKYNEDIKPFKPEAIDAAKIASESIIAKQAEAARRAKFANTLNFFENQSKTKLLNNKVNPVDNKNKNDNKVADEVNENKINANKLNAKFKANKLNASKLNSEESSDKSNEENISRSSFRNG